MTSDVERLLSELFPERDAIAGLLGMAGLQIEPPPAGAAPGEYWERLARALNPNELNQLVEAALRLYPASPALRQALQQDTPSTPTVTLIFTGEGPDGDEVVRKTKQADPSANLVYVADTQTAVSVADRDDDELQQLVERLSRELPALDVTYHRWNHRPYLYRSLTVYGPDQTPYHLQDVPSTLTPSEIASAVIQESGYAASDPRRMVVTEEGTARRFDPGQTLHEAGVEENDRLRIGFQSTAGAGLYEDRLAALNHAHEAVLDFVTRTPGAALTDVDDPHFPTCFTIAFSAAGFGPPADSTARPVQPVPVDRHSVAITLPPAYPVAVPEVHWLSPIFHPNIADGVVCLGALPLGIAELCSALIELAAYRIYEPRPADLGGEGFLDLTATAWALTPEGRERIRERGGHPWLSDDRPPAPPLLRLRRLGIEIDDAVRLDRYRQGTAERGGLLLGRVQGEAGKHVVQVVEAVEIHDPDATSTSWSLTTAAFATAGARQVVGWFHTHPEHAPPYPSAADLALHRDLFPHPWQVAVLVSRDGISCYQHEGGALKERLWTRSHW